MSSGGRVPRRPDARERIIDTAYALFSAEGVRAVGIDRIIAESGVAKTTLYHHFASKDALILAFLEERRRRWTYEWLEATVMRLAAIPEDRLLAVFDAFGEWFDRPDYESCSFVRTLHEAAPGPIRDAAVYELEQVRQLIRRLAAAADFRDPYLVAYQMQTIMLGAIVSAARGDRHAAPRARHMAALLLAHADTDGPSRTADDRLARP